MLRHILSFLCPWLETAQVQRGQNLVTFKMFYFSVTLLKGFCSCLKMMLCPYLCGKGSSMFFVAQWCVISLRCHGHGQPSMTKPLCRCPSVMTCFPSEVCVREPLLTRELTRKPSCDKVNQCYYWLEVIKWLISAAFSWRRKFWRKTYGYSARGRDIERNRVVDSPESQ